MNLIKENLFKKFISTIDYKPNNTLRPFVIVFIGLHGSGKSYISKKISNILNIPVCSNDEIRRFLNKQGFKGEKSVQDILKYIAESGTEQLLKDKVSHIIDADIIAFQKEVQERVLKYGAKIYFIKIISSEEYILKRLKQRKKTKDSMSLTGIESYYDRKKIHEKFKVNKIDVIINNDPGNNLNIQLDKLIKILKQDNVI